MELLPQVGTSESVLLTINLVKDRKVTDMTALQMLMALPFYLRQHSLTRKSSEEMLQACEVKFKLCSLGHSEKFPR